MLRRLLSCTSPVISPGTFPATSPGVRVGGMHHPPVRFQRVGRLRSVTGADGENERGAQLES